MISLRLRTKLSDQAVKTLAGKVLGPADYDVLLTGPTQVLMPDGRPLCVYLPGAVAAAITPAIYQVLHGLRGHGTNNRGLASGTRRIRRGTGAAQSTRTDSLTVASMVAGAVDPMPPHFYCRLTAWTGRNLPQWQTLHPLLRAVAEYLARHVPDRYAAQLGYAQRSDPAWVVPDTPFSTVTINNSYPTGCHTDRGDLDAGFSTITCLRRGSYTGGQLVFPQFRVAADLHDGDLILMDAHQWHANVPLICACGIRMNGPCDECGAERISVVAYYRTKVAECGSPAAERERALARADRRSNLTPARPADDADDPAAEAAEQAVLAAESVTPLTTA